MLRSLTFAVLAAWLALFGAAAAQEATAPDAATAEAAAESAPLADLLEVLRDDAARAELIAGLEDALAGEDAAAPEETAAAGAEEESGLASVGGQIADVTRRAAQGIAETFGEIPAGFATAQRLLRGLDTGTWAAIGAAAIDLATVFVVTVGVFILLRRLTVPLLRRIGDAARGKGIVRGLASAVGSFVLRVLAVVLAWAIGYGVMTAIVGEYGTIGLNQTLFLNAFLLVELAKVVVRTVVSPAADDLRALPLSDKAARRVTTIAGVAMTIIGYGVLLVVPIVDEAVSFFAARAVSVLVVELAVVYLAVIVVWHARPVGEWLVERMMGVPAPPDGEVEDVEIVEVRREGFVPSLLRHWHWFALIWLGVILVRTFTRPLRDIGETVLATLQIGAVALIGAALIGFIGRRMRAGVTLPEELRAKLPALEGRLNSVVPRVLMVLRALVAIVVVLFAIDQMGVADIGGWLTTERGLTFAGTLGTVAVILLVAWAIWLALGAWVDYRLNPDYGDAPTSREITLLTLLRSAVTIALVIFTAMFTLSELGLNIGPLIASAGVLGLAIGFGAQKLVQDIITGVFIQFENAINVGDVVTVGGTTGAVEALTVRSVTLRDLHGIVHIVPFSSVDMVSNFTREFSYYVIDMGIAYREDVDEAKEAMLEAYDMLREDPEQGAFLLGDLEYFGVDAFGDNAVVLKSRIKTWPGKQWGVGRAYNRLLKRVFDERGIEIPFPHRTIYLGEAKDGHIQTLPVAQIGDQGGKADTGRPEPSRAAAPSQDGPLGDGEE